jgi:pimeloyl-ACP methyl ester carboxylesterase
LNQFFIDEALHVKIGQTHSMKYDLPVGVVQRRLAVNSVELDVLEAGPADGPLIVLAHGFPESSWSWRHQLLPLAAAGWHVVAPDQRGYAGSTKPTTVEEYGIRLLASDLIALVDLLAGADAEAVFVGHDWGALIVWDLARLHPERCRATIAVSVPFVDWPAPPTSIFKMLHPDTFFYMLYFQEVGPAETELGADPRKTMRRILYSASGDAPASEDSIMAQAQPRPAVGTGFLDVMVEPLDGVLPEWCNAHDLDVYTASFEESGFFGPVSWYRNLDANYVVMQDYPATRITHPTAFIGGSRDPVIARDLSGLDRMKSQLPNYLGATILDGAGHWTQQEQPEAFNTALFGLLAQLG